MVQSCCSCLVKKCLHCQVFYLPFLSRYLTLCKPSFAPALSVSYFFVRVQVAVTVLVSLLIEIPRYFEYEVQEIELDGRMYYRLTSTELWESDTYQLVYKTIAMVVLRRLLPMSVTLLLTIGLVRFLHKKKALRRNLMSADRVKAEKSTSTVTTVLIIIAVAFIVCHTPGTIYPILRITIEIPETCDHFFEYFTRIADLLSLLNSALNFFIYYPNIPSFRRKLRKLCSNCFGLNEVGPTRSLSGTFIVGSRTNLTNRSPPETD